VRYFKYSDPWPEIENEKERYNRMRHDMARITRRRNKLGNVVLCFGLFLYYAQWYPSGIGALSWILVKVCWNCSFAPLFSYPLSL